MKVNFPSENKSSLIYQILQLQLILELSQLQELLSAYSDFLLFFAEYTFLFETSPTGTSLSKSTYTPSDTSFSTQDPARDGGNWYGYCENCPLSFIDPLGLSPTYLEAAFMAQDIYSYAKDETSTAVLKGGWERSGISFLSNGTEGGVLGIYSREKNGKTEYTLVNKGTNPLFLRDWGENFTQPFGKSDDLKDSVNKALEFVNKHPDNEITFTGHSKGGAEAEANALATGKNAILFNPATLFLETNGLSKEKYNGKIEAFIVKGEILNDIFGTPDSIDDIHELSASTKLNIADKIEMFTTPVKIGPDKIRPATTGYFSIKKHQMKTVIDSMTQEGIQ